MGQAPPYRFCGRGWSAQALQPSPKPAPFRPLPRRAKPAAGEGWGGGSDICRYTKSRLKYRPFTYTNPAILYVNRRQCCLGGGAAPPYRFCGRAGRRRRCNRRQNPQRSAARVGAVRAKPVTARHDTGGYAALTAPTGTIYIHLHQNHHTHPEKHSHENPAPLPPPHCPVLVHPPQPGGVLKCMLPQTNP